MTTEEIRKNAPDGCNLYAWFCGTICYFKKIGNTVYWPSGRPFVFASVTKFKPLNQGAFLLNKTLYNHFY